MPDRPVVVFDGTCGFCRYTVALLARRLRLPGQRLPWQTADLAGLGLSTEQVRARMWYLAPGRAPVGGAAAFAEWLGTGGTVTRVAGRVLGAPGVRVAADLVYQIVARYRHRIPGPWEHTCTI